MHIALHRHLGVSGKCECDLGRVAVKDGAVEVWAFFAFLMGCKPGPGGGGALAVRSAWPWLAFEPAGQSDGGFFLLCGGKKTLNSALGERRGRGDRLGRRRESLVQDALR